MGFWANLEGFLMELTKLRRLKNLPHIESFQKFQKNPIIPPKTPKIFPAKIGISQPKIAKIAKNGVFCNLTLNKTTFADYVITIL